MDVQRKKRNTPDHIYNLFLEDHLDCNHSLATYPPPENELYCPGLFDDWTCFNHTRAGTLALSPCPSHRIGSFNPNGFAQRMCSENGTWETLGGGVKTDYHGCVNHTTGEPHEDTSDFLFVYVFFAGSSLSLVLLSISLAIFIAFGQLRCDRVTIHMNLFISYVLTALAWIVYYKVVVLDGEVLVRNPEWCQILHVLAHCCTTTNFSWMFCEGLYMHIIIAHAMRTGKKLLSALIVGGWVVPVLLTVVYASVRGALQYGTDMCWKSDETSQWITAGPILASVVVNFCILINLVRLLMTKLRQIPDAAQNRKAAKATLILVPLFGLQYLVFPVRPSPDSVMHDVYLYFMAVIMSLQGSLAAITFCFCNGEVRSVLRRKWQQHRLMSGHAPKQNGFNSSTFVDGYSVDGTRDMTMTTKTGYDTPHKEASTPLMDKRRYNRHSRISHESGNSGREDTTNV